MKNTPKKYISLSFIISLFLGLNLQSTGQNNATPSSPRSPCDYARLAYNSQFDHKSPGSPSPVPAHATEAIGAMLSEEEFLERFAANQLSGLTIIDGLNFTGSEDEEEWNDKNESTGDGEEFEDLTLINLPRPVPIHGPSDEYSDEDSVNDFSLNE